jgi:hypothetical protein
MMPPVPGRRSPGIEGPGLLSLAEWQTVRADKDHGPPVDNMGQYEARPAMGFGSFGTGSYACAHARAPAGRCSGPVEFRDFRDTFLRAHAREPVGRCMVRVSGVSRQVPPTRVELTRHRSREFRDRIPYARVHAREAGFATFATGFLRARARCRTITVPASPGEPQQARPAPRRS